MARTAYWSSGYMLRITTGSLGLRLFISFSTSRPPLPGMEMSSRTRSKSPPSALASASFPSAASSTTMTAELSARLCTSPLRTIAWSSAMRIFTILLYPLCPEKWLSLISELSEPLPNFYHTYDEIKGAGQSRLKQTAFVGHSKKGVCRSRPLFTNVVVDGGATAPSYLFRLLIYNLVRPHHVVVFVVKDVAMPQVACALRRVEGVEIDARLRLEERRAGRGPAHNDPHYLAGIRLGRILQTGLLGGRRLGIVE